MSSSNLVLSVGFLIILIGIILSFACSIRFPVLSELNITLFLPVFLAIYTRSSDSFIAVWIVLCSIPKDTPILIVKEIVELSIVLRVEGCY